MVGVGLDSGKVKGQDVSLKVDIRMIQVNAKVPYSKVTITYKDYEELEKNAVAIKTDWNAQTDLSGIYDLYLNQKSSTASIIKFTASAGCAGGGSLVTSLEASDIVVKEASGAILTVSFVAADSEGIYTINGTFATGTTISLYGVVDKSIIFYEKPTTRRRRERAEAKIRWQRKKATLELW